MVACGGSNYWGQKFINMGHDVRLISPQFVKPYVTLWVMAKLIQHFVKGKLNSIDKAQENSRAKIIQINRNL